MRVSDTGDMWAAGCNSWGMSGSSIGTPILNSCSSVNDFGIVIINKKLSSPEIQTDVIRGYVAHQLTLDANVILTGYLNKSYYWNYNN